MRAPVIFDGRNLYDPQQLESLGFIYHSIGRAPVGILPPLELPATNGSAATATNGLHDTRVEESYAA